MPLQDRLSDAEKQTRLALNGVSVLRQLAERIKLPTDNRVFDELVALARAQRRTLQAIHRQLETDPLLAHLLKDRIRFRRADAIRNKSGKRVEELVRASFYKAGSFGFRGDINEWRTLLAVYPRV